MLIMSGRVSYTIFLWGGKMMHAEPHTPREVWGHVLPRKFTCSEVTSGGFWGPQNAEK